ncbi:MAG: heavy metal translocating P-type ATPase [Nevskia sp.]|nr:heavy metal translocating P-type ATPase [Nevskia sp.]
MTEQVRQHGHAAGGKAGCCHGAHGAAQGGGAPARDPVCGMSVDPAQARSQVHAGVVYYFCSERCRERFSADPQRYLASAPQQVPQAEPADARIYTCPMHPEVRQHGPGSCPKCGMALEPEAPALHDGPDPELRLLRRRLWLAASLSLPVLAAAMGGMLPGGGPAAWLGHRVVDWGEAVLTSIVVLWAGGFVFVRGWNSLVARSFNMWTLIALGTGAAWAYSVLALAVPRILPPAFAGTHGMPPLYFEAAAAITTLVILGQVLETSARSRTSAAIRALLQLAPSVAHRVREGVEQDVAVQEVLPGDALRVRPGEKVPVDGIVLEGDSHVDESMLSGESAPRHKRKGDALSAGTLNGNGSVLMCAERVGADTLLSRIVRMVAEAGRSRAPVQRLADRVAAWFVPAVMAVAVAAAATWWLLGPAPAGAHALLAAVSVLIIACPCALGLATPISVVVAAGRGAHAGVLVRDAASLERLQAVDTLVIDKTGTLTMGRPAVHGVLAADGFGQDQVLRLAAAVESPSEHPLARAIVDAAAARSLATEPVQGFGGDPGLGVWGEVAGARICAGNAALLRREGIDSAALAVQVEALQAEGQTVVLVAAGGRLAGALGLADTVKPAAAAALAGLRDLGVRVIMATGDNARAAQAVARALGLEQVRAGLLPQDKAALVRELQGQGCRVAMAGDGINDAPALAAADVGIAMGNGTDVAMESAGVTLVQGELGGIVRAIRLSRATLRNIRQNLFFAFVYNAVGVPVAAGVLYPWLGVLLSPALASLAMSLSSVSVIGNALRLRKLEL